MNINVLIVFYVFVQLGPIYFTSFYPLLLLIYVVEHFGNYYVHYLNYHNNPNVSIRFLIGLHTDLHMIQLSFWKYFLFENTVEFIIWVISCWCLYSFRYEDIVAPIYIFYLKSWQKLICHIYHQFGCPYRHSFETYHSLYEGKPIIDVLLGTICNSLPPIPLPSSDSIVVAPAELTPSCHWINQDFQLENDCQIKWNPEYTIFHISPPPRSKYLETIMNQDDSSSTNISDTLLPIESHYSLDLFQSVSEVESNTTNIELDSISEETSEDTLHDHDYDLNINTNTEHSTDDEDNLPESSPHLIPTAIYNDLSHMTSEEYQAFLVRMNERGDHSDSDSDNDNDNDNDNQEDQHETTSDSIVNQLSEDVFNAVSQSAYINPDHDHNNDNNHYSIARPSAEEWRAEMRRLHAPGINRQATHSSPHEILSSEEILNIQPDQTLRDMLRDTISEE